MLSSGPPPLASSGGRSWGLASDPAAGVRPDAQPVSMLARGAASLETLGDATVTLAREDAAVELAGPGREAARLGRGGPVR